jgi:ribonuclease VapC
MFVDASALTAIIVEEPGFEALADALLSAAQPTVTEFVVMETGLAVMRVKQQSAAAAHGEIVALLDALGVMRVPLTSPMILAAPQAHARYGKGKGHPAALNMGDCLSYAAARVLGLPLLFKGNDFGHTDIAAALPA